MFGKPEITRFTMLEIFQEILSLFFSFICLGKLCVTILLQHIHGIEVLLFKKERVVSPSRSKDHDRWKT